MEEAESQGSGIGRQPVVQPCPPPRKKSKILYWVIGIVAGCFLLFALLILLVIATFLGGLSQIPRATEFGGRYVESVLEHSLSKSKIAVIEVRGIIMDETGPFGSGVTPDEIVGKLKHAAADRDVAGVILKVDSPGGGITASDVIYNEVVKTKKAGKKVVILMGDLAASGGYYISAPADYIMAYPTAVTGSIGVIMGWWNAEELLGKVGLKLNVLKSGAHKDIMSPARAMTPEEKKIMEAILTEFYERFIGIVAEGRKLAVDDVRKLADGRVYTARQALELKLVDGIGYWDDCKKVAEKLTGTPFPQYVKYEAPKSILAELLGARAQASSVEGAVAAELLRAVSRPRIEYIWRPAGE